MKQGAMAVVVTWREMAVTEEAMGQWRWASEKCREGTVVMMKYEASNKKAAMMMKKVMGGGGGLKRRMGGVGTDVQGG